MADKEATVYIVDLGSSMAECNSGRTESDLDWSMRYVWDRICTTVAASRKTWQVGVVGLRTDETNNYLSETSGYDNISVLHDVAPMSMVSLRELREHIKPSENMAGDAISAIILAADMISTAAPKRLKYKRRIVLVTDGLGPIDSDDFEDISGQINDLGIELAIIGVDFDDAEYGFKEEDKSRLKTHNEQLLQKLVEQCNDGVFGTMAEAIDELETPRLKPSHPYKAYDGPLTLGDPEKYEDAGLKINVERYFMTKVARPLAASTVVIQSEEGDDADATQDKDGDVDMTEGNFAPVQKARMYKVEDPEEPGGKREVDYEDLAKGYEYGRTAVHISESERNITQIETTKGFSILGFISNDKYEPYLNMGETCVIVSKKFSEKDELALSALIHTLYETESYAVARLVPKDQKDPQLLLLMPSIDVETGFECLYDVPLPFAEDVRPYQFPPLNKVVTITGTVLVKHRLLPNDDLNEAMSDYVDAMDISTFGKDDEGNPTEYASFEENFSPMIHRVNQAIRFRATRPKEPFVPATGGVLTRFAEPPELLVSKAQDEISALIKIADVKKVPAKVKGRNKKESIKPLSNLDIDALLEPQGISEANSIPAFKQAIEASKDDHEIAKHTKELGKVVQSHISTSMADLKYDMALENMRVMREQLVDFDVPDIYNSFLRDLKKQIAAEKLGGPRRDFWRRVGPSGLGLITSAGSEVSKVTEEEAREFATGL